MNQDPIYAVRLLRLADFLDALPPARFDYGHWVGDDWGGAKDLSCGTTACALGWATVAVPECGLMLARYVDEDGEPLGDAHVSAPGVEDDPNQDSFMQSLRAGCEAFGLTMAESEELFTPDGYEQAHEDSDWDERVNGARATPKQVAEHIRDFVKRESVKP